MQFLGNPDLLEAQQKTIDENSREDVVKKLQIQHKEDFSKLNNFENIKSSTRI